MITFMPVEHGTILFLRDKTNETESTVLPVIAWKISQNNLGDIRVAVVTPNWTWESIPIDSFVLFPNGIVINSFDEMKLGEYFNPSLLEAIKIVDKRSK